MNINENTNENQDVTQEEDEMHQRRNTQSKYWVFTLNNYTELEVLAINQLVENNTATYVVYGYEVGESGTRHLQGYIELSQRRRFNSIKAIIPRAYLASRRGNAQQASNYCKKGGNFVELGTISRSEQGRRKDLERIATLVREGASLKRIAIEEPEGFIKYHKGIGVLMDLLQTPLEVRHTGPFKWPYPENIESLVMVGDPNIGKSEFAKFLLPKALWITHLDDLKKYASEEYEGLIFDDLSFRHLPRESQIHLLDWDNSRSIHIRYMTCFIPANTRKIFTCNEIQGPIFDEADPAIFRRMKKMYLD